MADGGSQRLDKWLWFARLVKTRTLASRLIEAGKVRVNSSRVNKPSATIKPGDVVTAMIARHLWVVEVLDGGTRRGPAVEAKELFHLLETTRPEPGSQSSKQDDIKIDGAVPMREPGAGRPTKRERRQMDRFRATRDD